VVEDDLDVAEVTAAFLKEYGFRVKIIDRSEAVLDLLQTGDRVDVILSDIMMPDGISGLQLAEQVRKLPRPIPVLLATGYSEAAADAASRGLPIITKPFSMEELCARVAELIAPRASGVQAAL
jgi:two-component system, NtrC family, sensor kinase